ncbi:MULTISPECIES: hypothetical protein [Lactiplantibacillus]|uniref:Uncharacterized protein n=1 Tax=Lactiplantibacillus pentosus TaxID=1589 RepID=A0AAP5PXM8_LACPE|nr:MULTISPECIES: hypothetical protein [Lactiplantibacillus]AUI77837.1 hypothetical protein BB562_03560 [Lactiplantibacillus pentosus]MBU7461606.1 hypothetical protein [Lactiplantibacillus pentosus]MBU7477677.1 hypothetical protein [Lactiplantibacillus pentosus]MBU7484274.1 hypothetical protein [Lactiplantibacillus sp. 30.2.29]MBU7487547.1 hypothetical protein [Lactiplantibacillus pentosus]
MQQNTTSIIIAIIYWGALTYVVLFALTGPLVMTRFRMKKPFSFTKRRRLMKLYSRVPLQGHPKQQLENKILKFTGLLMILMIRGQLIIAAYGHVYLGTASMCLLCLINWRMPKLRLFRRNYWKNNPSSEFVLVSDKRFKFAQFWIKSFLVVLIVMSISYLIFIVNLGTNS